MKKILVFLTILYLATHLWRLTLLPVFADESIYIRWAQLIIDDWSRYLFFPLNDGKTPLWMWLLVPFQFLGSDHLWSARIVAVLVGLGQTLTLSYLAFRLSKSQTAAFLAGLFTSLLPFWYFHHRIALIDGLLSLTLSLALLGTVVALERITQLEKSPKLAALPFFNLSAHNLLFAATRSEWPIIAVSGLAFGLSLYTKLPALLFAPALGLLVFLEPLISSKGTLDIRRFLLRCWVVGKVVGIGLVLFVLLKLNPTFGQLFSRGGDFLLPWQTVFLQGGWQQTIQNIPSYSAYFGAYLTWPILLTALASLFIKKWQKESHVVFWGSLLFILPIALLGKVVYPRYLFPATIGLTLASSLAFAAWWEWLVDHKKLWVKAIGGLAFASLLGQTLTQSVIFIQAGLTDPNTIPFVSADKEQYLTEWSSGHGIVETVAFITEQTQHTSVAVATEGYFGTLPDAVLLYFHRQDIPNLAIEGIGQPVAAIPDSFWKRAETFEKVYLVVNSHRMALKLDTQQLVSEYCRPFAAPCLQIWDITALRPAPQPQN